MESFEWCFPRNDSNENEGPNDGGITHFTANRSANVIRECIQNSLDARSDESQPVRVQIDLITLPTESFAGDSLTRCLDAAIKSPHNDEAHKQQFIAGRNLLRKCFGKGVKTLCITDTNTTGADDDLSLDGTPSKWEALTKSTGLSIKDQRDASGSYGLGKHAPFAVTDIRTVLYSTAWQTGGHLHRRFQGKSILVSHADEKGKKYRRTGYLGSENFGAIQGGQVPIQFRMDQPGLAVYIPGYVPETNDWENQSISTAIKHFFHAVVHGGLEVLVAGRKVNNATLADYNDLFNQSTTNFIQASRATPVAETDIAHIGHVTVRIVVADPSRGNRRQVALVRDAGMMISDIPRDMRIPGLVRLPPHWRGFTAIIECLSEGHPSVLRESESPSHNSISTQQISDRNRRRIADEALKELGDWCRERIKELVEPREADDIVNAPEVARFLFLKEEEGTYAANPGARPRDLVVTTPEQTNRAPSGNWARRGRLSLTQTTGGSGTTNLPTQKGKGSKKKRPGTTTRSVPTAFTRMRVWPGKRSLTHSIIVAFDNPRETLRNIQLMAAVEDGQDVQVGISAAYAGNSKLHVKHNKVTSLPHSVSDRCSIEFVAQVPINNKTYYLTYGGD